MIPDIIYDKIETMPREQADAIVFKKLQSLLVTAADTSPFYRERIDNPSISEITDIERFPILTKDEVVAATPPASNSILTRQFSDASVYRSGGTTGNPKFTIYSNQEFEAFSQIFVRTYHAAGLRATDRVANLFFAGDLYASFIFVHKLITVLGCLNFPIAGSTPVGQVADYVHQFAINAALGPTSYLIALARAIAETKPKESDMPMQKMLYAGEPMQPNDEELIRNLLGPETLVRSAGYGCVDLGLIAYQCLSQTGSIHHILFDHVYVEIVDPETNRVLEDGQIGNIVVTSLDKKMMPFIRLDMGDRGRKLKNWCSCGRTGQLLELLGRNDDIVRVGSFTNVCYGDLVRVISAHKPLTSNIQLVKDRDGAVTRLTIKVEVERDHRKPDESEQFIYDQIWCLYPSIQAEIRRGAVDIKPEIVPLDSLERIPRTGKVRHIINMAATDAQ